jgi:TonB-linked SusC/RagA family outer membrane protein
MNHSALRRMSLILLMLPMCLSALAQSKITGRVTASDDGSPIPFVGVMIKGTVSGTASDADGYYSVSVGKNAILVFSSVGFISKEVAVEGRQVVNVSLDPARESLDEVIMVAYGTAKKGTYTGAAAVVKQESIKDVPAVSFENSLTGKMAGVSVTTGSGQAGSVSSMRIRGTGSMNASNEPLYVIDGVPANSGDVGQMGSYLYTSNNAMNSLNPDDIESITILKDAAASSLYGSRAANGVVVVTTKKGRAGRPTVSFKSSLGITPSFATCNWDNATPEQEIEMYYELFWNGEVDDGSTYEAADAVALKQLTKRFGKHGYKFSTSDHTPNTIKVEGLTDGVENREGKWFDWNKVLFRTAVYQTYDISASGGNDNSSYYSSLSYTKDQGRSVTNDFNRIAGRVNLNQKIGKYVEFATSVNVARSAKKGFNDSRSTGNNYFMQSRNLLWPMYWPTNYKTGDPWTARYGSYAYNAEYYNNEWDNKSRTLNIDANETLTVKFTPDLTLKSVFSYDNTESLDYIYFSANHYNSTTNDSGKHAAVVHNMLTNINKMVSSTTVNYSKTFCEKHTLSLMGGFEAEKNQSEFQRASGSDLPSSTLHTVSVAGTLDAGGYSWGSSMASFISKAEYSYDNRYYFSASFRRDGSSKLSPSSRWGNFWSVAGAWRISEEQFMKPLTYISNLRLRGSYGINGTLPYSNYGWRALTGYSRKYMGQPGGALISSPDENLSWETSYTGDVALEFGLFDQRISGTVEYFNRNSKDLLQDVPISLTTGFGSTLKNVGEINNHGLEIELGGDIIRTNDWKWSAGFNASFIKSTVTKLYDGQDIIWYDPTGDDDRAQYIYREGQSTLALYGYEWAGVDQKNGKNMWYINETEGQDISGIKDLEVNGRAVTYDYNNANEKILADMNPKMYGGLSTDVSWKGLSLSLGFIYRLGAKSYDAFSRDVNDDGYYWERIMCADTYAHRWTHFNQSGTYPERVSYDLTDAIQYSSRHLNDGNFIRLKNVTVAYSLPKALISKIGLNNLRVYFNGANLWTLAATKLYDPEVSTYGTRGWEMPIGKTYTFGLELSF